VFFLAQQSIEKVMKAVLAYRKIAFRKTHDLVELAALLGDGALRELLPEDLMIRLGPYAVEMRYVNIAAPKIGIEEVREAISRLLVWAQDSVGDCL
jgi:HEPN domain-containing protein